MNNPVEIYDAPLQGKDYILQLHIKNGPLLRAMRARGFNSLVSLARATGLSLNTLSRFLSLKSTPLRTNGEWKHSSLTLSKVLGFPPDCLFPEQHLTHALAKSSGELEISKDEVALLIEHQDQLDPEQILEQKELYTKVHSALGTLPPRIERVLRLRFGFDRQPPMTLDQTAEKMGVTRERIRQIEKQGFRLLHHPSRLGR